MSYLVLDIETTGKQYDDLDETTKGYFRQWAERDAQSSEQVERELEQIKKGLPFSPFLGEVVAIGMQDDNNMGAVYFRADNDKKAKDFEEDGIQYRVGSEKEVLEKFWEVARNYYTFVTFNGRAFDAPFLMAPHATLCQIAIFRGRNSAHSTSTFPTSLPTMARYVAFQSSILLRRHLILSLPRMAA